MTTRSDESTSADLVARSARFRPRSALLALVLAGGACATAAYPGPRLPSDRVATVETKNILIDEIDGFDVRDKGPKFEVGPGNHRLVLRLTIATQNVGVPLPNGGFAWFARFDHSPPISVCVSAKPKHHYVLEPRDRGAIWDAVVLDGASDVRVPPCGPIGKDRRGDFPCDGPLAEESLASGVQKVTGCGVENVYGYDLATGQWTSVTKQAMFDMNCPPEQLAVHHLGGTAVSITGCGLRADYLADTPCADGLCVFKGWAPNTAQAH